MDKEAEEQSNESLSSLILLLRFWYYLNLQQRYEFHVHFVEQVD